MSPCSVMSVVYAKVSKMRWYHIGSGVEKISSCWRCCQEWLMALVLRVAILWFRIDGGNDVVWSGILLRIIVVAL